MNVRDTTTILENTFFILWRSVSYLFPEVKGLTEILHSFLLSFLFPCLVQPTSNLKNSPFFQNFICRPLFSLFSVFFFFIPKSLTLWNSFSSLCYLFFFSFQAPFSLSTYLTLPSSKSLPYICSLFCSLHLSESFFSKPFQHFFSDLSSFSPKSPFLSFAENPSIPSRKYTPLSHAAPRKPFPLKFFSAFDFPFLSY